MPQNLYSTGYTEYVLVLQLVVFCRLSMLYYKACSWSILYLIVLSVILHLGCKKCGKPCRSIN